MLHDKEITVVIGKGDSATKVTTHKPVIDFADNTGKELPADTIREGIEASISKYGLAETAKAINYAHDLWCRAHARSLATTTGGKRAKVNKTIAFLGEHDADGFKQYVQAVKISDKDATAWVLRYYEQNQEIIEETWGE